MWLLDSVVLTLKALNYHSYPHSNGHWTAISLSTMCNSLTTLNIVQGRLWLLYLVRLKRDSFPQHLLSLQDVLQRPRAMRWYHALQTSCVQIPAFSNFLCSKFELQTPGCHSAPPDCPSRSTVHPPSPEVHIWSLMIDQYWKGKKHSSKCTVYNLPSPHCTRPTNVILEQLPFRRESILTVCCQQNVRRDGKWKYFVESASFPWRHSP